MVGCGVRGIEKHFGGYFNGLAVSIEAPLCPAPFVRVVGALISLNYVPVVEWLAQSTR